MKEKRELSDAPRQNLGEQVENKCWVCGEPVMKARKLAKARCFDCRKKYNHEQATKHYEIRMKKAL